jgi:hypothetical protein
MATQRVTFTEWTPDLPGIAENLSVAKNVVPTAIGYAPFPTGVDYSGAASETLNNVFDSQAQKVQGVRAAQQELVNSVSPPGKEASTFKESSCEF